MIRTDLGIPDYRYRGLAGSVTWQAVTGEAADRAWRAVISPPQSLGQLDLFPGP